MSQIKTIIINNNNNNNNNSNNNNNNNNIFILNKTNDIRLFTTSEIALAGRE